MCVLFVTTGQLPLGGSGRPQRQRGGRPDQGRHRDGRRVHSGQPYIQAQPIAAPIGLALFPGTTITIAPHRHCIALRALASGLAWSGLGAWTACLVCKLAARPCRIHIRGGNVGKEKVKDA